MNARISYLMIPKQFLFAALLEGLSCMVVAADWPQWRGPQRNGISSETGLLKEWPKEGPKLLWQGSDIGRGYSTPAVVGDRIFLQSNDSLTNEFVEALAVKDGKLIWRTRLGNVGNPKQEPNFPAARSTPTVDGEHLYALGSDGDLVCVEKATGKLRWQKSLRKDFEGKPGDWAYAESPLADGSTIVCTPGGAEATLLALDKKTGEVIWKCAVPGGDEAAYSSALVGEISGVKQYVQMLQGGLVGVEASTGKFLWRYKKTVSQYKVNIPTPVMKDNLIYSVGAGTGGGLIKAPAIPGAAPELGDYLYGTGQAMMCVDFATGTVKWEERAIGPASLCFAGDRLYPHGENGDVALVEPTPAGYHEKGRFTPPNQPPKSNAMEKAWAYPVVANGRLYIRDHQMLWCYDVKSGS